ncbi:GNAT family N-acetyltransferase [Pedobacter sp. P351]|uniref:GNAT family N-acetyltransferase n=1 Tax=Pedobacter superstes TaxID=3133441 RepID=UPI0030A98217
MKYGEVELINNIERHNFELFIDGKRSFIDYKMKGDKVYLLHTEVPKELNGKGIAAALVEKTLVYLESNKLQLVPYCVYVQAFLKRHPEWNRLLAEREH